MVLRRLLGKGMRMAARRMVHQTVAEVVHRETSAAEQAAAEEGPRRDPCRAGLVFALGVEAGRLARLLQSRATYRGAGLVVHRGQLGDQPVALTISGAGTARAARAAEALITGYQPAWVFSAGFAGGLSPQLKRNHILMADRLVHPAGGELALELDVDPDSLAAMPDVHVGRLLSTDRIVGQPLQKRELGARHGALAVDMETFAVAEVCRRCGVPLLAVRVILDAVDDALPAEVEHLLAQKTSTARWGAVAGALWRRPRSFQDFYRLRQQATAAADRLARCLVGMIRQL